MPCRKRQTKIDFSAAWQESSPAEVAASTNKCDTRSSPIRLTISTPRNSAARRQLERAQTESSSEAKSDSEQGTASAAPSNSRANRKDKSRRAKRTKPTMKSRPKAYTHQNSGAEEDSLDEGLELQLPKKRQKRKYHRSSSELPEEVTTPMRRRKSARQESFSEESEMKSISRLNQPRRSRGNAALDGESLSDNSDNGHEEKDDLEKDLAFLKSSPPPDRGRLRSTHEKPRSSRQKALEALKKNRRTSATEPSTSATPNRKRRVIVESESDLELEIIKEETGSGQSASESDDVSDPEQYGTGVRVTSTLDMFQEDDDDENFIDDDADLIGEPSVDADLEELRLVHSLKRSKAKDLFKYAVEWMVMKKIHPAFDSSRNIYSIVFQKLDDEVQGLADSKFTSAAWTSDFTRSIRARPHLDVDEIGLASETHCEACNRSGHVATFELTFKGLPYDKDTLEPVEIDGQTSDSDSDSSLSADSNHGEKAVYNALGELLVPESHRFVLGSTCKANAQVSHALLHWRYHIYEWVKEYLQREGHLSAKNILKRDKWRDKKKLKAVHKIVDAMEQSGQVKHLYTLYRDQINFAASARNEYKEGWGRRGRG